MRAVILYDALEIGFAVDGFEVRLLQRGETIYKQFHPGTPFKSGDNLTLTGIHGLFDPYSVETYDNH